MSTPPPLHLLLPPLLYLLVSFSLFTDTLSTAPRRPLHHRLPSFLFAVFALSLCFLSLFHLNYNYNPTLQVSVRQASDPGAPDLGPQLPPPPSPAGVSVQSPTPAPSPSPIPPPTAPVVQEPVQQNPVVEDDQFQEDPAPTLDDCAGGLMRMQVLLLLEFIAEVIFLIIQCLAANDDDEPTCDISFRMFTLIRAIYAVPVTALNASILFIGGKPTGSCLPAHPQVQVVFTHLILYALFSIAILIFGLYRLGKFNSEKNSASPSSYYPYSYTGSTYPYPPSRTESYFRRTSRTRAGGGSSSDNESTGGHINCGCCSINF